MSVELKPSELIIENFRNYRNVSFKLGKYITVISGQNGVGKSSILSLIASGSGVSKRSKVGGNFQPEFTEFFNIDPNEPYGEYKLYLKYRNGDETALTKRLSFKNDTSAERGIRVIPRTTNQFLEGMTLKEAESYAKANFSVGGAARVGIPTIYLSLSRLHPLGEGKDIVSINNIAKRNSLYQNRADEKYKEWYNYVIPNSIKNNSELRIIDKKASSRKSLHMDIFNTPMLSQSVGQDNVGNIISALVDLFILSCTDEYKGALLCIDEIDVSLHPDTQLRMLDLMSALAKELSIQFVLSSHSLTILKELLKKEKKNSELYRVVYLKDPIVPQVTEIKDYYMLKADMFGRLNFSKPKVKVYCEDDIGAITLKLLIKAFKNIYRAIELNPKQLVLRNGNDVPFESVNKSILSLRPMIDFLDDITIIPVHLGCEELLKLSNADSYFKRVIIILDGDARLKDMKPKVKDYLDQKFTGRMESENGSVEQINDRKTSVNECFLPDYFAPESYYYYILRTLTKNAWKYSDFWHGLDSKEETMLYTPDKIEGLFSELPDDFNNDNLKKTFGKPNNDSEPWRFIRCADVLDYYYFDYTTVDELISFIESVNNAYGMCKSITMANKYS